MKQEIFNKYVEKVSSMYRISKEDMFSKTKQREMVDARHLLYFLCSNRCMRVKYIQKYLSDLGYNVNHSNIIYGISAIEKKIKEDADYMRVVKHFENSVSI